MNYFWLAIAVFASFGMGLLLACMLAATKIKELEHEVCYWRTQAMSWKWVWRRGREGERVRPDGSGS